MAGKTLRINLYKPKEIADVISNYFSDCDNSHPPQPYTIPGLAYYLEITTRELIDYPENQRYSKIIDRAKQKCEKQIIDMMFKKTLDRSVGLLFLKNHFGYLEREFSSGKKKKEKKEESNKTISQVLNDIEKDK